MKKILITMMLPLTLSAFGQVSNTSQEIMANYSSGGFTDSTIEDAVTIIGTVMLKGDIWVIQGTAGNSGDVHDYYPGNLTKPFKVNGLRVRVNARLNAIPENVRMAGTPITIVTIKKL